MTGYRRVCTALLLMGFVGTVAPPFVNAAAKKTIMMVAWLGCEDVCKGVKEYIAENNIDAEVLVRDASQDKSKLPAFAAEARALNVDAVITWGTKATLGMIGTLNDHDPGFLVDIPVIFTVVADPVGNHIIQSYENTGRPNVTGTRNRVPEAVNIKSIQRYMPGFSHLGMIFDTSEPNSVSKVAEMQSLTDQLKIKFDALPLDKGVDGTPTAESIASNMAQLKAKGVQWVYLGSSTFLEKQGKIFTESAVENGIAVLSPYEHLVSESQALMSVAARDFDVGKLAAKQAVRIVVEGKKPGDLPVLAIDQFAYIVNMTVAKKLQLYPPVDFLQFVEKVEN